jgi:pyruvate dehydrogenase E2 component (dihydrolipoamide acetyltransferase)
MVQSWTTVPCYDLTADAGVDALVELRSRLNASADRKTAVHDLLIRAVALALNEFEILTGTWTAEGVQIPANYGIGLAVATPHGLVAPVVRNARDLGLAEIARRSAALIDKARNARLEPDDLTGACATISNLGMFGIDHFRPIVIPGQGSILGVGRTRHVAAVADGKILPSRVMSLTLAVDHRLADGDYAARFLGAIKDLLEQPQRLSD